jgi:hypothetical protein
MSSVQAVTENIVIVTRMASFYPLNSEATQDIVKAIAVVMEEMGKKHNFIVWRVALELKGKE